MGGPLLATRGGERVLAVASGFSSTLSEDEGIGAA